MDIGYEQFKRFTSLCIEIVAHCKHI